LLSDDNGNTFNEWVNLLGGKSVNGNAVMFPHDESLPYHLYWQVLNAKNHGVPQNRERVFLIGIRDDEDNSFRFPIAEHLTKRLKDVLEEDVDDKYFLSEKLLSYFEDHKQMHKERGNGFKFQPHNYETIISNAISTKCGTRQTDPYIKVGTWRTHKDGQGFREIEDGNCPTIPARAREDGSGQPVIQVKSATSKGYEEATEGDSINFSVPNSETRRGRVGKGVAQTLDTQCNQGVIIHNIPKIVKIRKNSINIADLQNCLKEHKNKSIKQISIELNVPKTEAEHWFRTDKHFGIPNAEIWFDLKKLLNINTSEFDLFITEFIEQEGVFEKSNRVYDELGIAPTMTATSADERILNNYKIRRLTPRECFRLMDFPDTFTWPVSDSQAYKQAGNSIVVRVLEKIINNLNLTK